MALRIARIGRRTQEEYFVVKNWTKQCEQSLMQGHELIYLEVSDNLSDGMRVPLIRFKQKTVLPQK